MLFLTIVGAVLAGVYGTIKYLPLSAGGLNGSAHTKSPLTKLPKSSSALIPDVGDDRQNVLTRWSQPGRWDCSSATWTVSGLPPIVSSQVFHSPLDEAYFLTYGDSITSGVYAGLSILAKFQNLSRARLSYHNASHSRWSNYDPSIPYLRHFCCARCKCHDGNIKQKVHQFITLVSETNSSNVAVIFSATLHDFPNFHKPADEINFLLQEFLKAQLQKNITFLHLALPGTGHNKPKAFQYQSTKNIRDYDKNFTDRLIVPAGMTLYNFDPFEMFQASESDCNGSYSSLDGTHFSPAHKVAMAIIIRFFLKPPRSS